MAHDDGRRPHEVDRAEIVLTGVSRTSKTPLSMYPGLSRLAGREYTPDAGHRASGKPLQVDPTRSSGLTIRPERLAMLRQVRLTRLGLNAPDNYADPEFVRTEVRYAYTIFERGKSWAIIDTTAKSIEESANEIIQTLSERNAHTRLSRKGDPDLAAPEQSL